MTNDASVSVVIPVRNEAAKIRDCINEILSQSLRPREIIVVDSGSTDGTLEILAEFSQVKVISIPASDFNHGETRNFGVRATSSEFVALTVGDAVPTDRDWLRRLLSGFTDDQVSGVCGRQVVSADSRHNPLEWYRPVGMGEMRRVQFRDSNEFDALAPAEKASACGWDDVTAMYRKSALISIPFRSMTYMEDAAWALDALRSGAAIVYVPDATVFHYHIESSEFAYKRTLTVLYYRFKLFGLTYDTPSVFWADVNSFKILLRKSMLTAMQRLNWIKFNLIAVRARRKAVRDFNNAVRNGPNAVDALHELHCGKPPIPPKNMQQPCKVSV